MVYDNNGISTSMLTKDYNNGYRALDSLNISVQAGDIYGFLGPNGAGKTTTIRLLCGLLSPSSGVGKVGGFDIRKESLKIRNIIGLLPEGSGFYLWMNAVEYLLYFASLYKLDRNVAMKRIDDLLNKVGLEYKQFVPIGYYSRGMKQRLGLARAILNDPKILFLDEPTLGLDPKGQQDILNFLLKLNKEKNVTIFFSSHALSEVAVLANRIGIINRGRFVAEGTLNELRNLAGNVSKTKIIISDSKDIDVLKILSSLPFNIEIKSYNKKDSIDVIISDFNDEQLNILIDTLRGSHIYINEIVKLDMNLEDIFFNLTKSRKHKNEFNEITRLESRNISWRVN